MKNTNRRMQKWAGGFAILLAVAFITGCSKTPADDSADSPDVAPATPAAAPAPVPAPAPKPAVVTPPVRIKAGATEQMKDSAGNVWLPDQGFAYGQTYAVADAAVTNTPDAALYRSERYSMTAYNFVVPNGKYTVKLHFAEVYTGITGPDMRVFSFNVQGHEFKDFDIWVKAAGFDKAYVQTADVEVTGGKLDITFTPNLENPKICGIEILPRT